MISVSIAHLTAALVGVIIGLTVGFVIGRDRRGREFAFLLTKALAAKHALQLRPEDVGLPATSTPEKKQGIEIPVEMRK